METPSHILVMALFAACVGVVGGVLTEDTLRSQARLAGKVFGGLMLAAVAIGWVLYVFPL